MKEQDIQYINDLIRENSGVILTKEKVYLLEARLNPLIEKYKINDFSGLVLQLKKNIDKNLKRDVIEALMTNETLFFRDTNPFDQFSKIMLPRLFETRKSQKQIRIWCAGCSTGQEPYSLTMNFLEFKAQYPDWKFEILATDISTQALEKAQEGSYSQFEVQRGLPIQYLVKYMQKDDQKWKIKDEVKKYIKYQYFNLLENPVLFGKFDIIFCRNVLIYFDIDVKRKILDYLSVSLKSDGFLVLGGSETTFGICNKFVALENTKGLYVPTQANQGENNVQRSKA